MLIGPTLTLAQLEEKMKEKLYDIKMGRSKQVKNLQALQQEIQATPKMLYDGEKEQRYANPRYVELFNQFQQEEKELKESEATQEFIEKRLEELEDIEDRSKGRGNVDKQKDKITLTLNDCLMLGITEEDLQPKGE